MVSRNVSLLDVTPTILETMQELMALQGKLSQILRHAQRPEQTQPIPSRDHLLWEGDKSVGTTDLWWLEICNNIP